jgi:hypothetical protein
MRFRSTFGYLQGNYQPSLFERFCLLFLKGKWHRDEGVNIYTKRMWGKLYLLDEVKKK